VNEEFQWWADLRGDDIDVNAYGVPPYNVNAVANFIAVTVDTTRMLDIGCGPGRLGHTLLKHTGAAEVCGIDVSAVMLNRSRTYAPGGWHAAITDGTHIPFEGPFTSAYSVTVFQHIPHHFVLNYTGLVHDLLVPGGKLIFTYAVGEEDTFLSHQASHDQALSWVAQYSDAERIPTPDSHPAWNWMVATK
jgi:SAM-dependent methyltransferase